MKKLIMTIWFGCLLAGCMTLKPEEPTYAKDGTPVWRIKGTRALPIPEGMTNEAVMKSVALTIVRQRGKRNFMRYWAVEKVDPNNNWILLGMSIRDHFFNLCYRIEDGKLVPDVPYSQNLDQEGTEIHDKVPNWINTLGLYISNNLFADQQGIEMSDVPVK